MEIRLMSQVVGSPDSINDLTGINGSFGCALHDLIGNLFHGPVGNIDGLNPFNAVKDRLGPLQLFIYIIEIIIVFDCSGLETILSDLGQFLG